MPTTTKPGWWIEVEGRLALLTPADLPTAPWVFHYTPAGQSGNTLGGPFVTVHNNEPFLRDLKREVGEGPDGPRGRVVMGDLRRLRAALDAQENHERPEAPHELGIRTA